MTADSIWADGGTFAIDFDPRRAIAGISELRSTIICNTATERSDSLSCLHNPIWVGAGRHPRKTEMHLSCNKKAGLRRGEPVADVAEVMKGVLDEEFFPLGSCEKATLL